MSVSFFRAVTFGEEVGSGDNAAAYCELAGIAKLNGRDRPLLTANEFIASRLGLIAGLPTVPGVVIEGAGGIGWVSLRFGPRNEQPPPILPDEVIAEMPELAAGAVAFDCWTGNSDRHDENLAVADGRMYMFDHDFAVLGRGGRDATSADHYLQRHCLAGWLGETTYLEGWVSEIRGIRDRAIARIVDDAVTENALPAGLYAEATALLQYRRDNLGAILASAYSGGIFRKMKQWSLLLK